MVPRVNKENSDRRDARTREGEDEFTSSAEL